MESLCVVNVIAKKDTIDMTLIALARTQDTSAAAVDFSLVMVNHANKVLFGCWLCNFKTKQTQM